MMRKLNMMISFFINGWFSFLKLKIERDTRKKHFLVCCYYYFSLPKRLYYHKKFFVFFATKINTHKKREGKRKDGKERLLGF